MKSMHKNTDRTDDFELHRTKTKKQTRWYEYVTRNNMLQCYGVDTSNPDFSHTLMSGGVLYVPIERYKDLLKLLAEDIDDGVTPDFNEISPPITRLYMDLDFKAKSTDDNDIQLFSSREMKRNVKGTGSEKMPAVIIYEEPLERLPFQNLVVANCIAKKVAEYFPSVADKRDVFFHAHCMWRPSRFTRQERTFVNEHGQYVLENCIVERKFGMHMVWPNLYVTHEEALHLREGVIRALAAYFTDERSPNNRTRDGLNSWEEIVDERVYLPVPGMRMLLSDKYENCPQCKQRNLQLYGNVRGPPKGSLKANDDEYRPYYFHCVCRGTGKIPCNSIYQYQATVDGAGHDWTFLYGPRFKASTYTMLMQCSIRDCNRPDLIKDKTFRSTDHRMQLPDDAPRYPGFVPNTADTLATNAQRAAEYKERTAKMAAGSRQYAADTLELLSVDSKEFQCAQNIFNNADSIVQQARASKRRSKKKKQKRDVATASDLANAMFGGADADEILDLNRYANLSVFRLRRGEVKGNFYYLIDLANNGLCSNASYCHNVNRVHTCYKNVYFKITRKQGIVQKCLCWGTENRSKPCKGFESLACPLPQSALDVLFSEQLLQKQLNAQRREILIASGLSDAEIARCTVNVGAEADHTFDVVSLNESERKLLSRYAASTGQCDSATCDDANVSTSSGSAAPSPLDPLENVRAQRYEQLRQTQKHIIDIEKIERSNFDDESDETVLPPGGGANRGTKRMLTQAELMQVSDLLGDAPKKRKYMVDGFTEEATAADDNCCSMLCDEASLAEERINALYSFYRDSNVRHQGDTLNDKK